MTHIQDLLKLAWETQSGHACKLLLYLLTQTKESKDRTFTSSMNQLALSFKGNKASIKTSIDSLTQAGLVSCTTTTEKQKKTLFIFSFPNLSWIETGEEAHHSTSETGEEAHQSKARWVTIVTK